VCIIVFAVSIIPEAQLCIDMVKLLWHVPTQNQSWITLDRDSHDPDGGSLDDVKVQVAGMSLSWKVWNTVVLVIPKWCLTLYTAKAGVSFLMDTAGIDDIVVNSVALAFLLSLDELISFALLDEEAQTLLGKCDECLLGTPPTSSIDENTESNIQVRETSVQGQPEEARASRTKAKHTTSRLSADFRMAHFHNPESNKYSAYKVENIILDYDKIVSEFEDEMKLSIVSPSFFSRVLFQRLRPLLLTFLLAFVFVAGYYARRCKFEHGRFVPKPLYVPETMRYSFASSFLPWLFPVSEHREPAWRMPD